MRRPHSQHPPNLLSACRRGLAVGVRALVLLALSSAITVCAVWAWREPTSPEALVSLLTSAAALISSLRSTDERN